MRILTFALTICTIFGCWQPISWTSSFKRLTYTLYRMIIIFIIYTFMTSQFMNILFNVNDPGDMTETLYMMLTVLLGFVKIIFMWINAPKVITMVTVLAEKPFTPTELNEVIIRQKYDKVIEKNTLWYLTLVSITLSLIILTSIFTKFMDQDLTYAAWLPFNYTSPAIFFIVYNHQIIGIISTAYIYVGFDALFFGILMHICCQLDILEHRLTRMSHSCEILHDCICHHRYIYEYAYKVNDQFENIIGLQFIISTLVGCFNLYQLAMADIKRFIPLLIYTMSMYIEIFQYCWFANEVKLKSVQLINGIYNIEWPIISNNNKMALVMIMRRSMTPIKFTSAYIISMNLNSFVYLVKMSYSIYNLLQSNRKTNLVMS